MEYKKRGFFANIGGMFTGLVKPEEYIKTGYTALAVRLSLLH